MACNIPLSALTNDQCKAIMKSLAIVPKASFGMGFNKFGDQETSDAVFFYRKNRDSIDLPLLYGNKICQKLNIPRPEVEYQDAEFEFTGDIRPHQAEALTEAIEQLREHDTTTLALYTGFGKTFCAAYVTSQCQYLTCVFTQLKFMVDQWVSSINKFTTNRGVWVVGTPMPEKFDFIVCMNKRISKIPIEVMEKIGLVILDEAHLMCTAGNVGCLLSIHPKYLVCLTATPTRVDGMETMMHKLAGTHRVHRVYNKPFTVRKIVTNIELPTSQKNGALDFTALVTETIKCKERNDIILDRIQANLDKKILVFVKRISHVSVLKPMIEALGLTVGKFCSSDTIYEDGDVLIGTTSKMGVAFDQESACPDYDGRRFDLVILCCSFKNTNTLEQCVGRGLRSEDPIIEYLVDNVRTYKTHWGLCLKWFKARNAVLEEIKY